MSGLRNKNFLSSGFALSLKCILPPPFQKQIVKNFELAVLGGLLDSQKHVLLFLNFSTTLALGVVINLQDIQLFCATTSVVFNSTGKRSSLTIN